MDYHSSEQSKKRGKISVDGINTSSASSIIASSFDILTLILMRLPLKSLLVFKSVSKQWLSLISNPYFVHKHFLQNPSFSIPGLFWKQKCFDWNNPPEYDYIHLDGNINSYVPLKTINFAKEVFPAGIEIVQSCNGLLLCRNFGFNGWNYTYFVFNPFTKQHKSLPRSQLRKCGFPYLFNFSLAFDPYKSPYYKVIAVWGDKIWAGDKYRIEIYSSETTRWRLCEDEYTLDVFSIPCVSATFWNGSLNWNVDHGSVIYFVIDRELLGVVPITRTPEQRLLSSIDITDVTEYQGHFYLIERGHRGLFLNILEMDTAYTGWKVKCSVDLEQLKSFRKFKVSHPFIYVLFIQKGEENESPKLMVLTQGNMVLSYALDEMSFKRVYDISPQRLLGRDFLPISSLSPYLYFLVWDFNIAKRQENIGYYAGFIGCRIDIHKETNIGIPYKDLFLVWIVAFTTFLPVSSLFPYLYFLVRDFNVAKRQEDIGYYAGCIGCVYMIGRALTSVLWGILADRYGRKPIIILCSTSVIIFNALFGLSTNIFMAVSMRFLLGCFSGIFGPVQAYAVEVCREEYRTLALSVTSSAWAIGMIVGPVIGGFLAQPAEKYPNIFTNDSVFARFPYFLPSLCISVCATAATVACCWLPETLHEHNGTESCETGMSEKIQEEEETGLSNSKGSLFTNWPLISSILVMCVFSLHNMAYGEIFSLWAVSPRKFGGLSYTTKDVGQILSVAGIGLFSFQLVLYPKLERIFGPLKLARTAAASSIMLLSTYPFIATLSGFSLYLVINTASLLKSVFAMTTFTGFVILQNNTVSQQQRGAANGITSTLSSIFQAFGPAGGGALFSMAQKRINASFLPGTDLVFFVLNLILVIGLAMSFKPFLALPQQRG